MCTWEEGREEEEKEEEVGGFGGWGDSTGYSAAR